MKRKDPVLTPDLIRVLKIFLGSAFGLVLVLSFFNTYRADNTGADRTFRVSDANRLYFLNVRSIHYDRELRTDAGMTLFRHKKRFQSDSLPTLTPVIILNPVKEESYIYLELENADWPIQIRVSSASDSQTVILDEGNNAHYLDLIQRLRPWIDQDNSFELIFGENVYPLWTTEKEKDVLKTLLVDYFRLLE